MIVRLVDADNRPVSAPKDFTVDFVARLPSNATETLISAVLKAGQSSMRVELPPAKTEGFLYIWAKQPELRLGGTYLRVKPPARPQSGGAGPARGATPPHLKLRGFRGSPLGLRNKSKRGCSPAPYPWRNSGR